MVNFYSWVSWGYFPSQTLFSFVFALLSLLLGIYNASLACHCCRLAGSCAAECARMVTSSLQSSRDVDRSTMPFQLGHYKQKYHHDGGACSF